MLTESQVQARLAGFSAVTVSLISVEASVDLDFYNVTVKIGPKSGLFWIHFDGEMRYEGWSHLGQEEFQEVADDLARLDKYLEATNPG